MAQNAQSIQTKQIILIVVIAIIILAFYFILQNDQESRQELLNACTDYLASGEEIPENIKNNPMFKACANMVKKRLKPAGKESFGYGFDLYGPNYQRSEWIQGVYPDMYFNGKGKYLKPQLDL